MRPLASLRLMDGFVHSEQRARRQSGQIDPPNGHRSTSADAATAPPADSDHLGDGEWAWPFESTSVRRERVESLDLAETFLAWGVYAP